MMAVIPLLGVLAGVLTTLAGMGGGVLLLLVLSLILGPTTALAATAPALLVGNLHRVITYRDKVDRAAGPRFAAWALPGSMLGGTVMTLLSADTLRWLMVGFLVLAVLVGMGAVRLRLPLWAVGPAGGVIGALAATGGGAGVLAAPVLLGLGLTGETYVATSALGAVAMHVGRIVAYGFGGLVTREVVLIALVLTAAVLVGNALGKEIRPHMEKAHTVLLERVTLVVSAGVALLGIVS